MLSSCEYFQLFFVIFCVMHTHCADTSSQVEDLRVNKLIAEYFQIEEHLWQVIERREENTLEQIYQVYKFRLGDTHRYENFIERNRIVVDLDLASGLKFLNETTSMVFGVLKSQDFGGLDRFAHSQRVRNITEVLALINRTLGSTELWHDIRDVSCMHVFIELNELNMGFSPIDRMLKCVSNTTPQTIRRSIKLLSKCTKTYKWHAFGAT